VPPSCPQPSPRSLAIVEDLRAGMPIKDCAQKHAVSREWVRQLAKRFDVMPQRRVRTPPPPRPVSPYWWTETEKDYIVAHEQATNQEIATALGRTVVGVKGMRERLMREGRLANRKPAFTDADLAILDDASLTHAEVALRLNRSYDVVLGKRLQRGIRACRQQ